MFGVSCGEFWTTILGNQAEAIPNLPISPRTLDLSKKTRKSPEKKIRTNRTNQQQLHNYKNLSAKGPMSGIKTEENRKGRILAGLRNIWRGFFGDPSLTKSKEHRRKTAETV